MIRLLILMLLAGFAWGDDYRRADWMSAWADVDGDCQNTRAEILIRDSLKPVKYKNLMGCTVTAGLWVDPYSGLPFTSAAELEIDHLVPLAEAHRSGGAGWGPEQRLQFANDPENLVVVEALANRQKGDRSPAAWMPIRKAYRCEYVSRWVRIKVKYGLSTTPAEREALRGVLAGCLLVAGP